ncbi:Ig-like domain-containing protein [Reichenbachiella sp.]|uniref:Ig-like domain-containing protein n=1 Tax=Reichenbachiella sp. TaxID=2184521 RepID=UPI003BAFAB8F
MTKHYLISWLFLMVITIQAYSQLPSKASNPNDTWEIRWSASDEFNGTSPDWAKWIKSGNLPNTSSWKWDNTNNVKVENGIAELTMRHNPANASDGGTYFKSGILKSYNTFTFGYYEARIKGAPLPGSGVCPSFWLFSNFDESVGEGKTIYSEIDVVELQQFDWYEGHQDDVRDMDLNLHAVVKHNGARQWRRPKQYPEEQLNKWRAPWDPRADYHIYGCEVNENEIIWYVDGVEVGRKPNTYWYRPMNVTLSLGLRKPFVQFFDNRNNAINPLTDPEANAALADMPTSMYVDYVRVWEKTGSSNNPPLPTGALGNPGFEDGNLDYWTAGSGTINIINTGSQSGNYHAQVTNASVGQNVTLAANTTYTITAYGKIESGTNAFLGVSKAATNEFIDNYEITSNSFQQGSITFTTGATEESYRIWFWSGGTASCDSFELSTGGDPAPDVSVTDVNVSPQSVSLEAGETASATATVLPVNATNKQVSWSSLDPSVASVDGNGMISGVSAGTTTITVTTQDGGFSASLQVTVSETSLLTNAGFETGDLSGWETSYGNSSNVNGNANSGTRAGYVDGNGGLQQVVSLEANTTYILSCYGKVGGQGQEIYLGVTNQTTNTFIANHLFNATGYQRGEITFSTSGNVQEYKVWFWSNGGGDYYADDFELVKQGGSSTIAVNGVSLNMTDLSLLVGETFDLQATVTPQNAINKGVTWSTGNATVATVDNTGRVTAQGSGATNITVITLDGGFGASVSLSVNAGGSGCSAPAWEPKGYNHGDQVEYNGTLYEVKWTGGIKNGGCVPSSCAGWTNLGSCSSARMANTRELNATTDYLNMYPNPSRGHVTLDFGSNVDSKVITILNIHGKVWNRWTTELSIIEIETKELKGIYFLQVESNEQSNTHKLLIE